MYSWTCRRRNTFLTGVWIILILTGMALAGCAMPETPPAAESAEVEAAPSQEDATSDAQQDESATETTEATAPPAEEDSAAEEPLAIAEYVLDSDQTEARFIVEETLGGAHVVVTGVSSAVTGSLKTSPDQVAATEVAPIVIDATSFITDNNMRNGAIRRFVLYTNLYPEIVFTPAVLHNAPESVGIGEDFELEVEGALSVMDTTKDITFQVSARFETATELYGYGSTTILLEEFGVNVPMPPRVTWVADEVILELEFTAISQASPDSAELTKAPPQITLVQLIDPLDEPEFYCLDVPGFGASVQLDSALMAHTCKRNQAADEIFAYDAASGRLSMPAYDLCMEADGTARGSLLYLAACTEHAHQKFQLQEGGFIRLFDTELCLTVTDGEGMPAGGRSHLRRDLSLEACTTLTPHLAQWQMPGTLPR